MCNNRCFVKKGKCKSIYNSGYSDTFYYNDKGEKCSFRGLSAYVCNSCCNSSLPCCISLYGTLPNCPCESCSTRCVQVFSER